MTNNQRYWWRTAAAVGLLLLPGCSSGEVTGPQSTGTSSSSSAGAPTVTADPAAAVKSVGFDETYRCDDGVAVKIVQIEALKLLPFQHTDDPEAKEGDPYSFLTTETTNGTNAHVELVVTAVVRYGPEATPAAPVYVTDVDSLFELAPKQSQEHPFAFIIPNEFHDQVVMEVTVSIDPLRTAVFAGSITAT